MIDPDAEPPAGVRRTPNMGKRSPRTLDEARQYQDSYVVIMADYGGQVVLTYPVGLLRCDRQVLDHLAAQLSLRLWEEESSLLWFRRFQPGDIVPGGMGGGAVTSGLWLHPEVEQLGLRLEIEAVLQGRATGLDGAHGDSATS